MGDVFDSYEKLFSDQALEILDNLDHDPNATYFYELMSGAFLWSDDFPDDTTDDWRIVHEGSTYRYLLALRREVTLGRTSRENHPIWVQVTAKAPNWPGLRQDRLAGRIVSRLKAAIRLSNYEIEKHFEADEAEADAENARSNPHN